MFRFPGAAGARFEIVRQRKVKKRARRIRFDIRQAGTGATGRNLRKSGILPDLADGLPGCRLRGQAGSLPAGSVKMTYSHFSPANLFVAPRATRPLLFPRMF